MGVSHLQLFPSQVCAPSAEGTVLPANICGANLQKVSSSHKDCTLWYSCCSVLHKSCFASETHHIFMKNRSTFSCRQFINSNLQPSEITATTSQHGSLITVIGYLTVNLHLIYTYIYIYLRIPTYTYICLCIYVYLMEP